MTDEQKMIIVEQEIDKSQSFLSEAYKLIEMEMWNVSANRAYYALYHALLALMIHDGYSPKTHSGLITEFGKEYILTGIFDKKHAKVLSQMRTIREKCDYDVFYSADKEQIISIISDVRELIDLVISRISSPD